MSYHSEQTTFVKSIDWDWVKASLSAVKSVRPSTYWKKKKKTSSSLCWSVLVCLHCQSENDYVWRAQTPILREWRPGEVESWQKTIWKSSILYLPKRKCGRFILALRGLTCEWHAAKMGIMHQHLLAEAFRLYSDSQDTGRQEKEAKKSMWDTLTEVHRYRY